MPADKPLKKRDSQDWQLLAALLLIFFGLLVNADAVRSQDGFWGLIVGAVRIAGLFARRYADLVTAIFTAILAVATIRLWQSTNRLWQTAEREVTHTDRFAVASAKYADMAEISALPYVFTEPVGPSIYINTDKVIEYFCVNHGRTPAVLRTIWSKMVITSATPTFPLDLQTAYLLKLQTPLGTGVKTIPFKYLIPDDIAVKAANPPAAPRLMLDLAAEQRAFFVVEARYLDTKGNEHVTLNSWELDRASEIFVRCDDDKSFCMT